MRPQSIINALVYAWAGISFSIILILLVSAEQTTTDCDSLRSENDSLQVQVQRWEDYFDETFFVNDSL